jgi:hypothetical protein
MVHYPIFEAFMQQLAIVRWLSNGAERTTLLLILLYAGVFIKSPSSLPHTHTTGHHHDSASCHTDPCHIAIYHHGNGNGCNHPFHLTAGHEDCKNCDLITLRQLPASLLVLPEIRFDSPSVVTFVILPASIPTFIFHTDRGPPSIS